MLSMLELTRADLARHGDALARMRAGTLLGAVVRGAWDPRAVAALRDRFDREVDGIETIGSPFFEGRAWGRAVSVSSDLDAYLDVAERLPPRLARAFAAVGCEDYGEFVRAALTDLAGGEPVRCATAPSGRPLVPYSLREMKPGSGLAPHYENEAFDMPGMSAVRPALREAHQLSAYLTVGRPERGGALRVYDLAYSDPGSDAVRILRRDDGTCNAALDRDHAWVDIDLWPGDLVVFDAGRWWHRVTAVEGPLARWTLGVFFGRGRDDASWVHWS